MSKSTTTITIVDFDKSKSKFPGLSYEKRQRLHRYNRMAFGPMPVYCTNDKPRRSSGPVTERLLTQLKPRASEEMETDE